MTTTLKIVRYQLSDVLRSRAVIGYALFFLVVTEALLRFGDGGTRALLSLINVVLLLVPLVSIAFGTVYAYDAREFTELLLAQPIRRRQLFAGLYLGLAVPLSAAFAAGVGLPFAIHGTLDGAELRALLMLLGIGIALTCVFTAMAYVLAFRWEDKVRALGAAIATWLVLAILYDALVLILAVTLSAYPIERAMLGMMLANPVDLARVILLLQFDVSALMGYTGAVFQSFFGSAGGFATALAALTVWITAPVALGARAFQRKDF